MTPDEQRAADELDYLEAELLCCLTECTPQQNGPRSTTALEISALLRLASRLIREADMIDRERYVAMVYEVARQVAPAGQTH